jgi:pimeloyl-ACP methyl ester carboxylesterase
MSTEHVETGRAQANGADLYYETRGEGPALLLIAGGLADAGQFTALGEALAERYRVITYDRRGNSRSPAPDAWTATTVEEQADDAAALLEVLDISAASLYGHSLGAPIALDLAVRRPEIVNALVLHDPAMMSVLVDPGAAMAAVGPVIEEGMKTGGPPAAADAFYRFAAGSAVTALDPAAYERMKQNGGVLFGVEFESLSGWKPDEEALRQSRVPMLILSGSESPPFFREAGDWLAARTEGAVEEVPGGHGAPFDHAPEIAARIVRFIGERRA